MPRQTVNWIERHSSQTRFWHFANMVFVFILAITGLFLFTPLGHYLPTEVMLWGKIIHRAAGAFFIANWLLWIIRKPSDFAHSLKNIFKPWDENDKNFMKYFFPYMLNADKYHMPRQTFVKSGQRVSDFSMYFVLFMFAVTGVVLWIGPTRGIPQWLFDFFKMGHDICFMGWCILMVFHIYLGAGIFPVYGKQASAWMFGSGYVSETDGLYHWGQWAEEELASGENVLEVEEGLTPSQQLKKNEMKKVS